MDSLISSVVKAIDANSAKFIHDTFQAIATNIQPFATTVMIIFFVLYGYAFMQGKLKANGSEVVFVLLKVAIVYSLMTSWAFFSVHVVDVLTNGPSELVGLILTANAAPDVTTANGIMDAFIKVGVDRAMKALSAYAWYSGWFVAALILTAVGIFAAFMVIILMISKLGLALLLALAPFFILAFILKGTSQMFESWVRYCVTLALTPIFIYGAALLVLPIMNMAIDSADPGFEEALSSAFGLLVITIPSVFLMRQGQNIASSIAGGISLSTEHRTRKQLQEGAKKTQRMTVKAVQSMGRAATAFGSAVSRGKISSA